MTPRILLVDDDRDLVDLLTFVLGRAGLQVLPAYDSPAALKLLNAERPDLAVLDVSLGAWDGFDLLRDLRRRSDIPVIMLTGQDSEDSRVRGLELGADDYLAKPFSHRELVARIQAHLRRRGQEPSAPRPASAVLEAAGIVLNEAEHTVTRGTRSLDLTVTEFRLLRFMMLNAGTVVPTRTILKQVWGDDDPGATDVVRVTLHRLRRKLEADPREPRIVHTVPGVGVMLKAAAP